MSLIEEVVVQLKEDKIYNNPPMYARINREQLEYILVNCKNTTKLFRVLNTFDMWEDGYYRGSEQKVNEE